MDTDFSFTVGLILTTNTNKYIYTKVNIIISEEASHYYMRKVWDEYTNKDINVITYLQ